MKKGSNVLCIFTRILGGKTFSKELENYIASTNFAKVSYVNYDNTIFKKYKPPFYCRFSDSLQSGWRIKQKYKDEVSNINEFDTVFFQSYHLTLFFLTLIEKKYTVLALDSTPVNAMQHNLKARSVVPYSLVNVMLTQALNILFFKRIFKHVDVFLARTELVKKSLVRDYGIAESKILVTYLPSNNIIIQEPKKTDSRLKLIFAGNDWERKGGPFLLDVFNDACAEVADLMIVSTDPKVNNLPKRKGVTVINGMPNSELLSLMAQSDIFLFPSWKDELGLVLCEAASLGLAIIARESGAQGEFVQNGINGYLLDFASTVYEWQETILNLTHDSERLHLYKQNSLELARQKLNRERFEMQLSLALLS
ncbi:glycosyltransferase family 4 protein [Glaciecola sp. XM2]|uniref:glycosyltransferase n=1 Tax=Glaciecola sp. XM2 TaxID=1914931 RepID=UPI001BDDDD93|nr:glycosyltransferase [Glaciecola sp. XM2]MBT1450643.1 glycosyltransferase family 4 protein [Glaciecola sp. XM2]